jgi:hypothetical protein
VGVVVRQLVLPELAALEVVVLVILEQGMELLEP